MTDLISFIKQLQAIKLSKKVQILHKVEGKRFQGMLLPQYTPQKDTLKLENLGHYLLNKMTSIPIKIVEKSWYQHNHFVLLLGKEHPQSKGRKISFFEN